MFGADEKWLVPGDPRWSFTRRNRPEHPVTGIGFEWSPPKPDMTPVPVARQSTRRTRWSTPFQVKFTQWVKGNNVDMAETVGYSREVLRDHLQRQFTSGMSWSNYAAAHGFKTKHRVWVIDHIVPKRLFTFAQVREAYALTNLRPLWIDDNLAKANRREHLL